MQAWARLGIALLGMLCACQSPSRPYVPLAAVDQQRIAGDGLWVMTAVLRPEIMFTESVAKFLWWTHTASLHTYEGLWDPWPVVDIRVARELGRRFEIEAEAAPFAATEREQLIASLAPAYSDALDGGSEAFYQWFTAPAEDTGAWLRSRGGSYLLEMWLEPGVGRDSWTSAYVNLYATCRLVRDDGVVVWTGSGIGGEDFEQFEDFRALVQRDFATLQATVERAAENLVTSRSSFSPFGSFLPLPAER